MNHIEAMKQALEALENLEKHLPFDWAFDELQSLADKNEYRQDLAKTRNVITALRQTIEQAQKQEPVALKFPRHEKRNKDGWTIDPAFITRVEHSIDPETSFDFIPTMEQVQETLLALEVIPASLFTSPPQRQWVGLTDEEIQECISGLPTQTMQAYAKRIEAKLREKNT